MKTISKVIDGVVATRNILLLEHSYVYKTLYNEKTHPSLDSYELLFTTNHLPDFSKFYQAEVFISQKDKNIVIVNSGSRYDPKSMMVFDLFNSLLFSLGITPFNMSEVIKINDIILYNLGSKIWDYKFHYTGHSFGGVIAEWGAMDMIANLEKMRPKETISEPTSKKSQEDMVTALTFENPGARSLIEKLGKFHQKPLDMDDIGNFTTINNRKNFINSWNKPCGTVFNLELHNKTAPVKSTKSWLFDKAVGLVSKVITLPPLVGKLMDLYEMGITTLQKEHALENFRDFFIDNEHNSSNTSDSSPVKVDSDHKITDTEFMGAMDFSVTL